MNSLRFWGCQVLLRVPLRHIPSCLPCERRSPEQPMVFLSEGDEESPSDLRLVYAIVFQHAQCHLQLWVVFQRRLDPSLLSLEAC